MRLTLPCVLAALMLVAAPAAADGGKDVAGISDWSASEIRPFLIPPVDAPITRRFEAPGTDWGPGHRGIDYGIAPAMLVRAAAEGVVAFAGPVANVRAVTIAHDGGLKTTYSNLLEIEVAEGQHVYEGQWIGTTDSSHPGEVSGLHFGVKLFDRYVDPEQYLGPIDVSGAIHLAPIADDRAASMQIAARGATGASECRATPRIAGSVGPPNDNVVVAIAGIASSTASREPVFDLPAALGYPAYRVYRFSYRGLEGKRWHEPYDEDDTDDGLVLQAERLRDLIRKIAASHPDAGIDIVAHSQGGLIARIYLEMMTTGWEPGLPRVDHLVTFATPHSGTKVAEVIPEAKNQTLFVGHVLEATAKLVARKTHWIPDPSATGTLQLGPESPLIQSLAAEGVAYGTRVLALQAPNDVLVPIHRGMYAHGQNFSVGTSLGGVGWLEEKLLEQTGAALLRGHAEILSNPLARAAAYAFLRDAPPACGWASGPDDVTGYVEGAKRDALFDYAGWLFGEAETEFLTHRLGDVGQVTAEAAIEALKAARRLAESPR